MKKKIWIISGSRSEYFLLENLIHKLKKVKRYNLILVLTGSHFLKKYGYTYSQIKKNITIKKIKINLQSDSRVKILIFMSKLMQKFTKEINKDKPDLIILLGDRHEILTIAICAMILKVPIAHIHGGEITEGAFDDQIRHAITKLSHLHFVSTEKYKKRVSQMGENKNNVHNVGSLGVENIKRIKFLKKNVIEKKLKYNLNKKNLLITFHPVTLHKQNETIDPLLNSLGKLKDTNLLFTSPSADPGSNAIIKKIKKFVSKNKNSKFYFSLGQQLYFSCVKIFDGVVGNSSSGIIEVPSLKKGSINIGNRQKGRVVSKSIINCKNNEASIDLSLKKLLSKKFIKNVKNNKNPYYKKNTSNMIINVLKSVSFKDLPYKNFFDLS
jgi:GDP/UDP-N,N'-diacetylbacillosamine 2-epimerase (hydrolysing)